MCWSMFDDLCKASGLCGQVEQVWYKLPQEDIASSTVISEDKDGGIRELCRHASTAGEVDVYIKQGVTPIHLSAEDCVGEESEESDEDPVEEQRLEAEGEDPVEEVMQDDHRFGAFFEEVHNEAGEAANQHEEATGQAEEHVGAGQAEGFVGAGETVIDEEEFERQCMDAERPDPAMDSDEEWYAYDQQERATARTKYSKDKPPYLWRFQKFHSGEEFKDQLLRYVLKTNYDVKLCKWGQTKLAAICRHENCGWKIYCSIDKRVGRWVVKTYVDSHLHAKSGKARMLKQGVIARLFRDEARRRPGLRWTDIKDEIMMRYTISVSKWICQKARRMAFDMVTETQRQQFAKLWDYEAELRWSNPDTHTEIVTIPRANGKQQFDKFYCCFKNLRTTWKSCCRPVIGLDGAFLKWELKGEILAAVGRDADNRIYPVAWAIVRVENNDSWAWFVEHLKKDLDLGLGSNLTVISDKQKGLLNAVADLLPNAEHRHCARHIYANWRKVYGDYCHESYFWAIAYSANEGDYVYNMEGLKDYDPPAHEDLLKTEPRTWCRAFFSSHSSCEDVCNNLSESFNRTIKEARKLPVINLLEEIRKDTMKRISRRYDKAVKWESRFPPRTMDILEANRKSCKFCSVIKSSESLYEVSEGSCGYRVNLFTRQCACNQWSLTGIPCPHAIYVLTELNRDPEDYVERLLETTVWQANYKNNIEPVNGERMWPKRGKGPIEVPEKRKTRGRPKKFARIKEAGESSTNPTKVSREGKTVTCSNCKQTGHNKGTCKRPQVQSSPPRKRGRPRKRPDNDDPWSIHNAPKRWHQSQCIPPVAQNQSSQNPELPQHSSAPAASAPAANPSGRGRARGRPPGTKNGCGKTKTGGKGRGRGSNAAPNGPVFFMSPWSDKVFDVWRPEDK